MRLSTILMLAAAFVCAAGAATLAYFGLQSRNGQQAVAVAPAPPPPMQKLVVAARDLKPGDKLTADAVREVDWPAATIPRGAFQSRDALLKGPERTFVEKVTENEPLLPRKLSGFNGEGPLAAQLGEGMRAITIRVSEDAGVGGFAQPGDRVDVLLTRSNVQAETGGPNTAYTATLVQDARVLATDQQTQRRETATPPKAVTLEVSAEDAQKLVLGANVGQLSLTLNRGGGRSASAGVIQLSDLERPDAPEVLAGKPPGPVVGVTRSVERKEYRVLPEETSR